MTWLSVDNRGPSAIHIAADSRISWIKPDGKWDTGRKTFAAGSPDIFGYCGEVMFPALALGQFCDLVNRGLLWDGEADAQTRHRALVEFLPPAFERRHNARDADFTIIHASRDGVGMESMFHLWRIDYVASTKTWSNRAIKVTHEGKSKVLAVFGSGSDALDAVVLQWNKKPQGHTARSFFGAFCEAIESGKDPGTGGMPQIVSLNRDTLGTPSGFVDNGERYIYGTPVSFVPSLANIAWFNRLFERVDPETFERLSNAQQHADVEIANGAGFLKFIRRTATTDEADSRD